jgi:ABC-type Fe3+/spermidine/putrescine transport system ATPase subunit
VLERLETSREPGAAASAGERRPNDRLALRGLYKRYRDTVAVRGVDLAVEAGSFVTILGPSGSGKSTLLKIIAGFTAPDRGCVLIDGRDVTGLPPAGRSVGMVFQNYALFPHMTAAENVEYGLRMRRWPRAERRARVAEMLGLVGLSHCGGRLPRELSGGQQQRIALARALAFRPSLLLLDEPLGALDRELRMRMAAELRRIQREVQVSALYVTHDREEALTVSDRIAIIRDGALEALDSPRSLYSRPNTVFVASFFGGHNIVRTRVARRVGDGRVAVTFAGREVEAAAGQRISAPCEAWLSVPQRAFSLTPSGAAAVPVGLRIRECLYLGDAVRATVSVEGEGELSIVFPAAVHEPVTAGDAVTAYLDAAQVVVIEDDRRASG